MISYMQGLDTFNGFVGTVLILLCGLGCALAFAPKRTGVHAAIWGALAADLLVLLMLVAVFRYLSDDSETWHILATQASDFLTGRTEYSVTYVDGKLGYLWIVGGIYAVTGSTPMAPIMLGIVCHLLLVTVIARITALLAPSQPPQAIRRSAYLAAFLPCIVWWTPHILRESLTFMLVATPLYGAMRIVSGRGQRAATLAFTCAALATLIWIRGSLGYMVTIGVVLGVLYVRAGRSRYHTAIRSALIGTGIAAFPFVFQVLSESLGLTEDGIAIVTSELSDIAVSGFPGLVNETNLLRILSVTIPRVLAGPFPWELAPNGVMALAFMELVCWLAIGLGAIRARKAFLPNQLLADRRYLIGLIIVVFAVVIVALAITAGNYGILARFRPIATVVIIPLAGIGFSFTRSPSRSRSQSLSWVSGS